MASKIQFMIIQKFYILESEIKYVLTFILEEIAETCFDKTRKTENGI